VGFAAARYPGRPVRIVFFTKSKSRTRTPDSIETSLRRLGHDVLRINQRRLGRSLGRRFARAASLAAVRRFQPDLVVVNATDADMATLQALSRRHRTLMLTSDCWGTLGGEALERARRVDLLLTVAYGELPALRAAGVHAEWLPEACDPSRHAPTAPSPELASEVAFIGKLGARHAGRRALVEAVAARFDTALYGAGWQETGLEVRREEIRSGDYAKVCASAAVVLGRDWTDACECYFSNRTWLTLGCGGFLLTNHVPGLERIFSNHRELVWFRDVDECLELIAHYLKRPEQRRRIAEAGRAFVLAHRTYDHFARELIALADGGSLAFPPARELAHE
jgi:hypothetical protein